MNQARTQYSLVIFAVLCGVITTVAAFITLNSSVDSDTPAGWRTVLAAADNIGANTALEDTHIETLRLPDDPAFDDLYARAAKPEERSSILGRKTNRAIASGSPLFSSDVVETFDIVLSDPQKRALSLSVAGANAMNGLLVPGDRVDIAVTIPDEGSMAAWSSPNGLAPDEDVIYQAMMRSVIAPSYQTEVVVEDVRVLAVGSRLSRSRTQLGPSTGSSVPEEYLMQGITIEVTIEQAKKILNASGAGANPVTLLLNSTATSGSGPG